MTARSSTRSDASGRLPADHCRDDLPALGRHGSSLRWLVPTFRSILVAAFLCLGMAAFSSPPAAILHLALRGSAPAQGDRLATVPSEIRLEFTEPVEAAVSTVRLLDPSGSDVALGAMLLQGEGDFVVVPIEGPIGAGEHTVEWQAVGRDGHPVRGTFVFVIEAGAAGIAAGEPTAGADTSEEPASSDEIAPVTAPPQSASPVAGPSSASPFYTAVRWLMYVGILSVIGSLGLALVLSRIGAGMGAGAGEAILARGAAFGLAGAIGVALSLPLRLFAQARVVFGADAGIGRAGALLGTFWGTAWLIQAAGCLVAAAGLAAARADRRWGWSVAGLGAVMLAVSPGLGGHAAAVEARAGLAIIADSLHVAAAGLWIGTLAAILFAGLPAMDSIGSGRRGGLVALVRGFSPLAMIAAGVLVGTGLIATSFQIAELPDLWATSYGRTLSGKIAVVFLVLGLGAYNWRRLTPSLNAAGAEARLRRSGGLEVGAAMVAILLTAALVALQPPAQQAGGGNVHDEHAAEP